MSKITLTQLSNVQTDSTGVTQINANSTALQTAFDNTLSRDGTTPNQMGADLDMNSNRILNLPAPASTDEPLRLGDAISSQAAAAISSSIINALNQLITTNVNNQSTSYTLQQTDNQLIIAMNNAGAITLTLPNGLAVGFSCIVEQEGAGQITFTPGAGATMLSSGSANKSIEQYSTAYVYCASNSNGSSASYRVSGSITI